MRKNKILSGKWAFVNGTIYDPFKKVTIEDIVESDGIFTILMGAHVEPRRNFIEENALRVKNLDV